MTYGLPEHAEYRYSKSGYHNTYTRKNIMIDLEELILDIMPSIMLVVDYDVHPDHRATSLLFDECMGNILKKSRDYEPLILKKFAYVGVMRGEKDYYDNPKRPTLNNTNDIMENPTLKWKNRIQFGVGKENNTLLLSNNLLYKAACKYKSQTMWYMALQFCNADSVYWRRNTDNLLYHATIQVSSGDKEFLNDFKTLDSEDVRANPPVFKEAAWIPKKNDQEKKIRIHFKTPVAISFVSFYEAISKGNKIMNICIDFNNGYKVQTGELIHDGSETKIDVMRQTNIREMCIYLTDCIGTPGISELEIFDKIRKIEDYDKELSLYVQEEKQAISLIQLLFCKLELLFLETKHIFLTRILPNRYIMKRKYNVLVKRSFLIPVFYIWNPLRAILKRIFKQLGYKGDFFDAE